MPTHNDFALTQAEIEAITAVTDPAGSINWDHDDLHDIRQRIKSHFRTVTGDTCGYCQRSLTGEFKMVIDVEHILPRHKFPQLTFASINLTVACKRCNMFAKGRSWAFVNGLSEHAALQLHEASSTYQLAHPNVDDRTRHLELYCVQRGITRIIFYDRHSEKGEFTYDFFRLKHLTVNTLDAAQGIKVSESEVAVMVDAMFHSN